MRIITSLIFLILCCNCKEQSSSHRIKYSNSNPKKIPDIPKSIVFFGERVNLEDEDIRERLDREIITNVYFQSSTTFALKRANRYFPEIEQILKKENVPDDFKYLAVIESNLTEVTSPVGASGFWQFMPYTAKEYGLVINNEIDERLNLKKSTIAACQFLKNSHTVFKDWINACASYNRGIGGVHSDMAWQQTTHYFDTDMNNETGRYVFRIIAMKLIMENPTAYGFNIPKNQLYHSLTTKKIKVTTKINNLAEWSKNHGINLKILRKLNPWLISDKLTLNPENYSLKLPTKTTRLRSYHSYL